MKEEDRQIVVFYHASCMDGFGGALAANLIFGNKAEYIALRHGEPPRLDIHDKLIYFIDFAYSVADMKQLMAQNEEVIVIDHHITAKESAMLNPKSVFNNERSGSVLAWQYFHKGKKVPRLLLHIEDFDLWKFTVPKTHEVLSFLKFVDHDFKVWKKMLKDFETIEGRKKYLADGAFGLRYEKLLFNNLAKNYAELVSFEGYEIYALNAPGYFSSDLGNLLVNMKGPMAIVWSYRNGRVGVSLRSDGKFDVGAIALKYGGGGHKASAGFALKDFNNFPWKLIK